MSRLLLAGAMLAPVMLIIVPDPAPAQSPIPSPSPLTPTISAEQAIANAVRLTSRRTAADCRREAAAALARGEEDIIVCAAEQDQALPVPEVYGPVYGSTDGRAVDIPACGLSLQDPCYEGFNLLAAIPAAITIVSRLLDPDQDLGEAAAIPERFRGANR